MKEFIESYGLNLLGDTIAGFLGLATFFVVVITYFAQKTLAKQTVMEMKSQNDLNAKIANANYKVMLFDRRLELASKLNKIAFLVQSEGAMSIETRFQFVGAVEHARWIFDGELLKWLEELSVKASSALSLEMKTGRLLKAREERGWNDEQEKNYDKMIEQLSDLLEEIEAQLEPAILNEKLENFLALPPTIITEV